jgi:hypothetical protein
MTTTVTIAAQATRRAAGIVRVKRYLLTTTFPRQPAEEKKMVGAAL